MPPKKDVLPKPGSLRTAFVDAVATAADLTHEHALQLAGLGRASGFSLGNGPRARDVAPSSIAAAGPSGGRKGKGKAPEREVIELLDTDDELDLLAGPSSSGVASGDPHVCSRIKCAGNPNCLAYLGQDKWLDDVDKARQAFLKKALPDGNPMNLARKPGTPCGLRLGATCYANALLQTWFHNEQFRSVIFSLAGPPASDSTGDFRKTPLYQLQTVFHGLEASNQSHFDPKGLVQTLELEQSEQQDAQEFSKLFLDLISKAVPPIRPGEVDQNAVEAQFGGSVEYVTKCRRCKYESRRASKFTELDLTIQYNKPVEVLLQELMRKELMSGDNKYDCPQCGKLQDADRYTELISLPPTLNLSLLRFVFDPNVGDRVKTKRLVKFPPSIDMSVFVSGPAESDEEIMYDLRAVLVHKGESANSGHYCAQVYNTADGKWYECDDEAVLEIKPLTPPPPVADKPVKSQSPVVPTSSLPSRDSHPRSSLNTQTTLPKLPPFRKKLASMPSHSPEAAAHPRPSIEATLDSHIRPNQVANSDGSSPAKKRKSDIPPWASPKVAAPISISSDDEDDVLQVEPRPPNWQPSFRLFVPEPAHASTPTPLSKRTSPERAAASATLSHAQAGSSQRTADRRSSPPKGLSASPGKGDYQSSKDAYMLVYQRRQRPDAMRVEPVSAPAQVEQDIARQNLDWETSCKVWELKQAEAAAAFEEVLAAKKAVFDVWEVSSFDEPAVVLQAADLAAWADQGLWEKPTKGAETAKATMPTDETPKACNACSEGSELDGGDAIVIDGDDDEHPSPASTATPAVVEGDLSALDAEKVSSAQLENTTVVHEASQAFETRLKAAALSRELTSGALCPHGKTNPIQPSALNIKRTAVDRLVQLGCTLATGIEVLSADSLCLLCTQSFFQSKATRKQHAENQDTFKSLQAIPLDPDGPPARWVSKAWFRSFTAALPKGAGGEALTVDAPTDEQYQSDVFCPHGKLGLSKATRREITPDAYAFLQTLFDGYSAPSSDNDLCEKCREDRLPEMLKAAEEKQQLPSLAKRCLEHIKDKRKSLPLGQLAVIDTDFLLAWYHWVNSPASFDRPTVIDTYQFVCAHDKLTLDLSNRQELDDHRFGFVTATEWAMLKRLYEHGPTILAECEDSTPHDSLSYAWDVDRATCNDCRRVEKRAFDKGCIDVIVTESDKILQDLIHRTDFSASSDAPERKGVIHDHVSGLGGMRKSKRKRGAAKTDHEFYDVEIDHSDSVKTIKVAIADLLDTSVLYLTMYKGKVVLDDASKTVDELDIIPGDYLVVFKQPDVDEGEQEQLALAGHGSKVPRRSQADHGAGFGGTLLSGGFGGRLDSSQSKPVSSSTSSTLQSGSPEPSKPANRSKGRSLEDIAAALEAGENVSEGEMSALFAAPSPPSGPAGVPCSRCTFVNEADAVECAVCSSDAL